MANVTQSTRTTRTSTERKKSWRPPARLETPSPPPGYKYRWVRHELRGEDHAANVYGRTRQGYEPVRPEELGENYKTETMEEGKHAGVVRSGDLILMKVSDEIVSSRTEYFDDSANKMDDAIKADLSRHQTREMPISNESESSVSFGARTRKLPNAIQE